MDNSTAATHSRGLCDEPVRYDEPPNRTIDYTFAGVLIAASLWGTVSNAVGLWFFTKDLSQNRGSRNSLYFKRVYQAICSVDMVICASVFPIVEAFMQEPGYPCFDKVPVLFGQSWLCYGWVVVWETAAKLSVLLVAVLSVSRLFLLILPNTRLNPVYFWCVMGFYTVLSLTYEIGFVAGINAVSIIYIPETRYCRTMASPINSNYYKYETAATATAMVQLAVPILVVVLSFGGTMIALCRSYSVSRSRDMHNKAVVTVSLVTLLFIVFHVPLFVVYCYWAECITRDSSAAANFCKFSDVFPSRFMYYYTHDLFYIAFFTLNSAIDPIVYFFRMDNFQKFVVTGGQLIQNKMSTSTIDPKVRLSRFTETTQRIGFVEADQVCLGPVEKVCKV